MCRAMYICVCNAVTERQVRESVACGVDSLDQLAFDTGLGICCGRCREYAQELLEDLQSEGNATPGTCPDLAVRDTAAIA